ncbi:MAG: CocE/NonD family hydrolase [Candidatus Aminicenantes bacterium]|nr:CocE/NonD family hydrolase [Candidatus Aminicenantes bacterium]
MSIQNRITAIPLLAFLLAGAASAAFGQAPAPASAGLVVQAKFGDYPAIAIPLYDSWVRTSQYVKMRDGIRLAVDILRPARKGSVETMPLPVLWTHTRYRRASVMDGKVRSSLEAPHLLALLKRGYILAAVDVRGAGASFGVSNGVFTPEESEDAREITEWLAVRPWSDGKIGMFGGSYLGITQLMAAARKPPHLKAIMPMVALFDLYDMGSPGGVFREDFTKTWSDLTRQLDHQPGTAPVDEDKDGKLLKAALEEHRKNRPLIDIMSPLRFRDSLDQATGTRPFALWDPASHIKEINESGIPVYLFGGWYDSFTSDQFALWRNLSVPKRLTVGAWSHSPRDPAVAREELVLLTIESLRWYDYWLKGIDTGVMNDAPITYQVMLSPGAGEWRTAADWPLPAAKPVEFYPGQGKSGTIGSANDGFLRRKPAAEGADALTIDYSATSGTATRWDNAVGGGFGCPDMAANDRKGLTYTTPLLGADLEVTGAPVVKLWIDSTAKDADVFAYLEEVDAKGISTYVTEGVLRASQRIVSGAPYNNDGLPYHRGFAEDARDLAPGEPVELDFEMEPTSNVFNAGHRLRLTITGADKDNAQTPALTPPPVLKVHRGKGALSALVLPVVGSVQMAEPGAKAAFSLALLITLAVLALVFSFTFFLRRRMVTKA